MAQDLLDPYFKAELFVEIHNATEVKNHFQSALDKDVWVMAIQVNILMRLFHNMPERILVIIIGISETTSILSSNSKAFSLSSFLNCREPKRICYAADMNSVMKSWKYIALPSLTYSSSKSTQIEPYLAEVSTTTSS
jgi:hypothetical protein